MPTFHFDTGTLLASETLICLMFSLVLFIVGHRFPDMRGAARLGQAFAVSAAGTACLLARSLMPLSINVLVASGILMLANLLFYAGVDTVLNIKPRLAPPALIALIGLFLLTYFTFVDSRPDMRIFVLAATDCLMQVWLLTDLLRYKTTDITIRLLAASVLLTMLVDLFRGITVEMGPSLPYPLHSNLAEAAYMLAGIFAACGLGIFSLMLITGEITAAIERNARRDSLTGVLNRRGVEEFLKGEIDRARRGALPLSVALIDVDHFKSINDSVGHLAGDETLRHIANCITSNLRTYDACGRIGGDEFLVLLPGSSASSAIHVCDRIRQQVATLPPRPDTGKPPTISIGFTENQPSDTPDALISRADRALYAAKRGGRNRSHSDVPVARARTSALLPSASTSIPAPRADGSLPSSGGRLHA